MMDLNDEERKAKMVAAKTRNIVIHIVKAKAEPLSNAMRIEVMDDQAILYSIDVPPGASAKRVAEFVSGHVSALLLEAIGG